MITYTCEDCGKRFTRASWKAQGKRHCDDCAIKRILESTSQLYAHEGPYYEKWKKNMKAAARRLRMQCKFNETKECISTHVFDKWKDDKMETAFLTLVLCTECPIYREDIDQEEVRDAIR